VPKIKSFQHTSHTKHWSSIHTEGHMFYLLQPSQQNWKRRQHKFSETIVPKSLTKSFNRKESKTTWTLIIILVFIKQMFWVSYNSSTCTKNKSRSLSRQIWYNIIHLILYVEDNFEGNIFLWKLKSDVKGLRSQHRELQIFNISSTYFLHLAWQWLIFSQNKFVGTL
jgi:hypothetical protein